MRRDSLKKGRGSGMVGTRWWGFKTLASLIAYRSESEVNGLRRRRTFELRGWFPLKTPENSIR